MQQELQQQHHHQSQLQQLQQTQQHQEQTQQQLQQTQQQQQQQLQQHPQPADDQEEKDEIDEDVEDEEFIDEVQSRRKPDARVTVHRDKFLIIEPTRCTNFSKNFYFWNETLHVSDSSRVHHQEFSTVHTAMVYVIQVC